MTSWLSAVPSSAMELPSLCPLPCFKRNTAASAWWHGLSQGNKIRSTRAWFLLQSASGKSRQQDKASRFLRSRDGVLRFSLCLFPLWQGPGSAPCDGQTPLSCGRGLPLQQPQLSCPTGTAGFPHRASPKLGVNLEGRGEALGKFTGKISGLNSAVWDGKYLKTVLAMQSPA